MQRVQGALVGVTLEERPQDGRSLTIARFAATGRHPKHGIKLFGLRDFPRVAGALATSFAMTAATIPSPISRAGLWSEVAVLLRFLREEGEYDVTPQAFGEALLGRFVHWLNRTRDGVACLSVRSRRKAYNGVSRVIATGVRAELLGEADTEIDRRSDPWAGQHERQAAKERFATPEQMTQVLSACLSAAVSTMRAVKPALDALDAGATADPVVAAAQRVRCGLARGTATDGDLGVDRFRANCPDEATWSRMQQLLLPRPSDLAPFFIVLTHYSAFNPSTLFHLRVGNIRRVGMGSARWTTMTSYKGRSGTDQRATFADDGSEASPGELLNFLQRWTSPIRDALGTDHLWVRWTGARLLAPDSLGMDASHAFGVRSWLQARELPAVNLSQIRKGMLDLVHLNSGGDREEVRAAGGQRSPDVVDAHYVSPQGRQRERERLGFGVAELERWITSDGKVDARRHPDASDRTAASPGFACMDNLSSEMPGQRPGRPCAAYGKCPICPLAKVDVRSARACGYLHLLLDRIEEGLLEAPAASAREFHGIWAPVRKKLTQRWLPLFDTETRRKAKLLDLPALARIE